MNLIDKIKSDLLEARKSRDKLKARLLTTLVGDCAKVGYTVDGVRPVTDSECMSVVKKTVKNLKELTVAKEERGDDVTTETAELKVLMGFLPSQIDDDQFSTVIEEMVFTSGCQKIGIVMKMLKQGYDGTYDPRRASAIAKDLIESLGEV